MTKTEIGREPPEMVVPLTPFRRRTLEHIRRVNDAMGCGARCSYGEMIEEAEAAIADGQSEWRDDGTAQAGRWLTKSGRAALTASQTGAEQMEGTQ